MTAGRSDEVESGEVTGGRLVVVAAFAPVVPQVERGLDGLVAVRVLGLVGREAPLRVHVVHRHHSWKAGWKKGCSEPRAEDGSGSPGSAGEPVGHRPGDLRIAPARGARRGTAATACKTRNTELR